MCRTLDVQWTDRVIDLVDEGFDLAVRIARLSDSSLISRRLASTHLVLCAAPSYLKRQGGHFAHPRFTTVFEQYGVMIFRFEVMTSR